MQETGTHEANPQDAGEQSARRTCAPYYVYMLRCEGGALYTGITTDVVRRMREHLAGAPLGARYTQTHRPLELVALWLTEGRAAASRLEYRIKRLSAGEKRALAASPVTVSTLEGIEDIQAFAPVADSERKLLWEQANGQSL